MRELSVLIPARNEMWLSRTVQDLLANIEADTEIIVVLDGAWADPPLPVHPRLNVVYLGESIGQRAATNLACRLSQAKWVMKVDAHCAFDKGFDRKMLDAFKEAGDDVTMAPLMKNLHVFDWVCPDGHRRYQGPSGPCAECGKPTERDVVWIPKKRPESASFCFDPEPHFDYNREFTKRPGWGGDLVETMSLQGSCFMLTAERYWALNISDESFGSWGSQGIEVACKTWLSGGRVLVNRATWYAHLFRTQGGDFSFPYPQSQETVDAAKAKARELFFRGRFPLQTRPLSWLVEKFWPIVPDKRPGWTDADLAALKKSELDSGVLYN